MDKIEAARIEGMLVAARTSVAAVADPLRTALPLAQRKAALHKIAVALTELLHLSWEIYDEHPEINPDKDAKKRLAAYRRQQRRAKPRK